MAYEDYAANVIRSFEDGREVKRAKEKEAKTKQFGDFASQLTSATDRKPILSQMSAIDPALTLPFDTHYGKQDADAAKAAQDAEKKEALFKFNRIRVLLTAPMDVRVQLYKQSAPDDFMAVTQQLGREPTAEEITQQSQLYAADLASKAGIEMKQQEPETFTGQPTAMQFADGPGVGRMGSRGTIQRAEGVRPYQAPERTPQSQYVPLTAAELTQVGLPPGSSAQRDTLTGKIDVLSKRDTGGQLSQKDSTTAKLKLNTVALARKQLEDIRTAFAGKKDAQGKRAGGIKGSMSAGLGQGYLPTEGGKGFDAAVDQMRGTLTALTRVPGVGAMSDYETRLDQAKFPDRKNYESVTEQQIDALEDHLALIENGYRGLLEGGAQQQNQPQATQQGGGWGRAEVVQ